MGKTDSDCLDEWASWLVFVTFINLLFICSSCCLTGAVTFLNFEGLVFNLVFIFLYTKWIVGILNVTVFCVPTCIYISKALLEKQDGVEAFYLSTFVANCHILLKRHHGNCTYIEANKVILIMTSLVHFQLTEMTTSGKILKLAYNS